VVVHAAFLLVIQTSPRKPCVSAPLARTVRLLLLLRAQPAGKVGSWLVAQLPSTVVAGTFEPLTVRATRETERFGDSSGRGASGLLANSALG
jgi:hypothetical protein